MQFDDAVVGGTYLVRPAIQSPDYKPGTSGWTINQDGTAEFNNVSIRATLESANYVPGSAGWKLDQNGTAEFSTITVHGNGTITGSTVQTSTTGQRLVLNPGNHATGVPPSLDIYTGAATETSPGQIISEFVGDGEIILSSPSISGGPQAFMGVVGDTDPRGYILADDVELVVGSGTGGVVINASGGAPAASLTVNGGLTVRDTSWSTYTPTVGGGGSATFGIQTGWYYKIGDLVYVEAYITMSHAGSGTSAVTVSLPSTPYRGSAQYRQVVPGYGGGIAAGSNSSISGSIVGLVLAGGTGAMFDQLRGPTDVQLRGDNLQTSTILTVNGWYREN